MQTFDYSQNDPRWKNDLLGFSSFFHLGTWNDRHDVAAGCAVTSFAMMASYLGNVCTPADMNHIMKEAGLINSNGDFTVNDVLSRLFPNIEFIERVDWPDKPAPLNYFDIINDTSTEIIVLIDSSPANGLQQHWLRVRGWDGHGDILVVDPWDGTRKGLSAYAARDGKTVDRIIYAAIKFRRRPATIPTVPAPGPAQPTPTPAPTPPPTSIPSPSVSPPDAEQSTAPVNPPAVQSSPTPSPQAQPDAESATGSVIGDSSTWTNSQAASLPSKPTTTTQSDSSTTSAYLSIWRYLVRFLVQVFRRGL